MSISYDFGVYVCNMHAHLRDLVFDISISGSYNYARRPKQDCAKALWQFGKNKKSYLKKIYCRCDMQTKHFIFSSIQTNASSTDSCCSLYYKN